MSCCSSNKPFRKRRCSKSPEIVSKSKISRAAKLPCEERPQKCCAEHASSNGEESKNVSEASPAQGSVSCHNLPKDEISEKSLALKSVFSRVPQVSLVREPLIEKELKSAISKVFCCSEASLDTFNSKVATKRRTSATSICLQPSVSLLQEPSVDKEVKLAVSEVFSCSKTSPKMSNFEISVKSEVGSPATSSRLQPRVILMREPTIEQKVKSAGFKVHGCSETRPAMCNSGILKKREMNLRATSNSLQPRVFLMREPGVEQKLKLAASRVFSSSETSPKTFSSEILAKPDDPAIKRTTPSFGASPKPKICVTSNSVVPEVAKSSTFLSTEINSLSRSTTGITNSSASEIYEPSVSHEREIAKLRFSIPKLEMSTLSCLKSGTGNASISELNLTISVSAAFSEPKSNGTAASSKVEMTSFKPNSEACVFLEPGIHETAAPSKVKMTNFKLNTNTCAFPELRVHEPAAPSKVEMTNFKPNTQPAACAFSELGIHEPAAPPKVENSKPNTLSAACTFSKQGFHEIAALSKVKMSDSKSKTDASSSPDIHETIAPSNLEMFDFKPNTASSVYSEIHETAAPPETEMVDSGPKTAASAFPKITETTASSMVKKSDSKPNLGAFGFPETYKTAGHSKIKSTDSRPKPYAAASPELGIHETASLSSVEKTDSKSVLNAPDIHTSSESVNPATMTSPLEFSAFGVTSSDHKFCSKPEVNISISSESDAVPPATTSLGEDELSISTIISSDSESRSTQKANISFSSESEVVALSASTTNLNQGISSVSAATKSEFLLKSKVVALTFVESEVAHPATTNFAQDRVSTSATTINLGQDKFSTSEICSENSTLQTIANRATFSEPKRTDCPTPKFKFSSPASNNISPATLKSNKSSTATQFSFSVFKFSKPIAVLASHNVVTSSEESKHTLSVIPKTADFSNSNPNTVSDIKVSGSEMPLKLDKCPISFLPTVTESEKQESCLPQHLVSHVMSFSTLPKEKSVTQKLLITNHKSSAQETNRMVSSPEPCEPLTSCCKSKTPESPFTQESPEPVSSQLFVSESPSVDPVPLSPKPVTHLSLPNILISDMLKQNPPLDLISSAESSEPPPTAEVKSVAAIFERISPPKMKVSSIFGVLKRKHPSLEPVASLGATVEVLSSPKMQDQHSQVKSVTSKAVLSERMGDTTENNLVLQPSDTPLSVQVTSSEQILKNLLSDVTRKFRKDDECSCDEPMNSSDLMTTDVPYHTITGCVPVDILSEREITNDNLEIPSWRHKIFTSCYSMEGTENLSDDVFEKRHARLEQEEKRRKRWDVQRIREQRQLDHLRENERKRNWLAKSDDENDKERPRPCSLYPTVSAATRISVDESLPVNALGVVLKKVEPREFSLPWKDGNTSCGFSYDVDTSSRTRRK